MSRRSSSQTKLSTDRRFVNEAELEALTSITKRTWQKWRLFGRGPRFYRLGGAVRYDLSEVLQWIETRAVGGGDQAA